MVKLSIIIVNYNSGEHLVNCLNSIKLVLNEADLTIFIVDNDSSDASINQSKTIRLTNCKYILNKENLGFGKGCNQALQRVTDEFVLLLNPDTQLEKGVLKTMIRFMEENKDVGVSTCKVLQENGQLDWATHRGFPTPWASFLYFVGNDSLYHLSKRDLNTTHEVDAVAGAFFLTRKSILDRVGFFDEDYFMYAEDVDLCYRVKQAGYKIMYVPTVKILHHKGISSGLKKNSQHLTTASVETKKRSLNAFYSTMKIFYKKHYEKKYPFFLNRLIYLAINAKWWLAKRRLLI